MPISRAEHDRRTEIATILPWSRRRSRAATLCRLLAIATVAGCLESEPAAPKGPKKAAAVQSPDDCFYDNVGGAGGADLVRCHTVTVLVEPPVEAADKVVISTDLDSEQTLSTCTPETRVEPLCVARPPDDPSRSTIVLSGADGQGAARGRYPKTVKVRVTRAGATNTQEITANLKYRCFARTFDDWCWEAEPVTLSRGAP